MEQVSASVMNKLKNYVYAYSDPANPETPFYIGRGVGMRAFSHLKEDSASEKVNKIKEIFERKQTPVIEIIRHGMTIPEAKIAESVAIDLFGLDVLTNKQSGHSSKKLGRMSLGEICRLYGATPVSEDEINEKILLIRISRAYRPGMDARSLYEATRRAWDVSKDHAEQAEYAVSVFEGVILEVYKTVGWFPAGTIFSERDEPNPDRFEFVGDVAKEGIRKKLVGRSVAGFWSKGAQKPYRYVNC